MRFIPLHPHIRVLIVRPLLEGLLPLPRVPLQRPTDAVDPILTPPPRRHHIGERIPRRAHRHVVPRVQLDPLPAVETRPAAAARVVGHADAQDDRVGEDDGPEGERVRADGGQQNHGVFRVAEGAAGGEVVGCRPGGRGNADAVGLYGGEMLVIAKDLDGGHCLGRVSGRRKKTF